MYTETEKVSSKQAITLAIETGEIMLTCGAETNRTEDTMLRIINKCGYEAETFVTVTGIFVCVTDDDKNAFTMIKRIKCRSNNLQRVVLANDLSRNFVEGRLNYDDALLSLSEIKASKPPYRDIIKILAAGVSCGCFSYLLAYSIPDAISALLVGIAVQFIVLHSTKLSQLLRNIMGGAIIAILSEILVVIGLGDNIDTIIIGAVIPLLPGIAFTNAIRDIVEGDYLSGASRLMEAVLIAIGIATGVGVVLQVIIYAFGVVFN